jgi:hypothetical protein
MNMKTSCRRFVALVRASHGASARRLPGLALSPAGTRRFSICLPKGGTAEKSPERV